MLQSHHHNHRRWFSYLGLIAAIICLFAPQENLFAQAAQGVIVGRVQDTSGAVIPQAALTLTDTETGVVRHTVSNASGTYTFPPLNVGHYEVSASAPGFKTVTQRNIRLNVQERLNVVLTLPPGAVSQTVVVSSAPPLMQTQDASVGQTMSSSAIDHTPLNGRNWVYIAQLSPGTTSGNGSRGSGKGDFTANGQRPEQNNFILNGMDNNSYAADFMNGSSYGLQPPPDAISQFKVQTANFSAQFGHSAGAVVNASIRSGTDRFHGSLWEYWRNDALDARDFGALTIPKYRENQFGATLGGPIVPKKLFFFAYAEANRIVFGDTYTGTVPSLRMRNGDFSELLNPSLTSNGKATTLYQPGSAGTQLLACDGQQNVMCADQINPIAQRILNYYPLPNTNGAKLYQNYKININDTDNTWQWGTRLDWSPGPKDQMFFSYSYSNERGFYPPPLGPIIDAGGYTRDGQSNNLTEVGTLSETHQFSPSMINVFRIGYNYGKFVYSQVNPDRDTAAEVGLGGVPFESVGRGGLPSGAVGGITTFGPATFNPAMKGMNVFNLIDNFTKIAGKHSITAGFYMSDARLPYLVASNSRGSYTFNGFFTGAPGKANTGFGVADFLSDQMSNAVLGSNREFDLARLNIGGYVEDDWQATRRLTLNLGVRYDFFQPVHEPNGYMASLVVTGPITPGHSEGVMLYDKRVSNQALSQNFLDILAENNITVGYTDKKYLSTPDHLNFAPRIGFSYMLTPKTVVRGGYGIFYGGLQVASQQRNYPFQFTSSFPRGNVCVPGNCQTNGITLENGFSQQLAEGVLDAIKKPAVFSAPSHMRTQYSSNFNLTVERSITNNMSATIAYVGSVSRHLAQQVNINSPAALTDPRLNQSLATPFPTMGPDNFRLYAGSGSYNSFQSKLQKRFSNGLNFLASYTWSHALNNAPDTLGTDGDAGYRAPMIVGIGPDYSNSGWDTRHKFTFNGYYQLPFGVGHAFLNRSGFASTVFGGWATDLQFSAQTGFPLTVDDTLGRAGPNGGKSLAVKVGDPFRAGGGPGCATRTRTIEHWFNPCAFANPPEAFPNATPGTPIDYTQITGSAALPFLGGRRLSVAGPGYERINMSLFKTIPTFREQRLTLRVDAFNVLNTPAYANPSISNNGPNGGLITGARSFQNLTPDARFFQLSAKYAF